MKCCQDLYVTSGCAVYDDYPNIIGPYIGENVVGDDGTVGLKYTHSFNSDVTLELHIVSGIERVSFCWLWTSDCESIFNVFHAYKV